jgi:hypothetical protein
MVSMQKKLATKKFTVVYWMLNKIHTMHTVLSTLKINYSLKQGMKTVRQGSQLTFNRIQSNIIPFQICLLLEVR